MCIINPIIGQLAPKSTSMKLSTPEKIKNVETFTLKYQNMKACSIGTLYSVGVHRYLCLAIIYLLHVSGIHYKNIKQTVS